MNFYRLFILVGAALLCCGPALQAQEPQEDTLDIRLSTEDILKAKVDSLRDALSAASPSRRRLNASRLLSEADSLRMRYDFPRAVEVYGQALATAQDTSQIEAIQDAMTLGRNGLNMMGYCSHPVIVDKRKFALEDFFLMYPMEDGAWRKSPNALDPQRDAFSQATYIPDSSSVVYYSAPDADGIRNIYRTSRTDSTWSVPQLINERITSSSNEIYPTVSPDGRTLYFASKGLYGMGGYDLYMSSWNRQTRDWDEPVNMGFPYSSPYDDFLFINTDDGKYSIFASNRECSADSVYIYVLEYDAMPVRKAVSEVRELRQLALLNPAARKQAAAVRSDAPQAASGVDISSYMEKMSYVRAMRDSIYQYNLGLDAMRADLSSVPADKQSGYVSAILAKELGLPDMQKRLDAAIKDLQAIELEFLASGVVIDPGALQEEPEVAEAPRSGAFEFVRKSLGQDLEMAVESPEPEFDYTFRILPEGQFAESSVLPAGVVYQIQIASGTNRFTVKDLRGLSPVFEKMSTSLRYTYSVGVFRTYNDVLSHLNSVKKAGFRDAFITAYVDGDKVSVDTARSRESAL